jgi:hypothetical protein
VMLYSMRLEKEENNTIPQSGDVKSQCTLN